MRRETDFVLEKAAWPTMLLEGGGGILRANQAARSVLGVADNSASASLASIWDDKNAVSADKFLSDQGEGETSQVKLKLHGGKDAPFFAHVAKVARDGQNYFLLQLFKESGAAFSELAATLPAPKPKPVEIVQEKKETVPAAMDAAWPALVMDKQGKIVDANPAAVRLFGGKAVAKGVELTGLLPEESAALRKLLQQPSQSPATPLKVLQADGKSAPFRIESCLVEDAKWIVLQFFKAEEPKPAPKKEAEEEFLLQNAEWPVLLVHKNGRVARTNRAGARAFGPNIEREDAQLSAIWSPQNRDTFQQFLDAPPGDPVPLKLQMKSGFPEDFVGHLCGTGSEDAFVLQLLKGAPAPAEKAPEPKPAAAPPQPAPTPPPPVQSSDTTLRSGVEASLAHKQKLDCALQLARSVSLDFNNALTSILGHASLLLSQAEANHPWRNSLGEIEKSAAKAAEIANDLAAFSRQEKDVKGQVAGNMNSLLERTMEMFQGSMQRPITITRQLERKLYTATFDEAKMQQAIVKIFENAVESITGSGKINVLTRNLELTESTQDRTAKLNAGNYVCVEISDTGAGITDEVMPRIFEPFFTTKGTGHRGLGLAWVYGIVTNHGGGVAVSSQVGTGSVVRLYLPAGRKVVRDAPAEGDLHGTETILLVDDEDLLLTMGQMVLSSYGYTVLTANSGQKALDLFTRSKKKVDLVITDLVMPNMSGRELGEQILKATPGTKIIWSSGYVRSANEQEQERYLQKPFAAQDLLRKVKQVLAQ